MPARTWALERLGFARAGVSCARGSPRSLRARSRARAAALGALLRRGMRRALLGGCPGSFRRSPRPPRRTQRGVLVTLAVRNRVSRRVRGRALDRIGRRDRPACRRGTRRSAYTAAAGDQALAGRQHRRDGLEDRRRPPDALERARPSDGGVPDRGRLGCVVFQALPRSSLPVCFGVCSGCATVDGCRGHRRARQ